MPSSPTRRQIEQDDARQLRRQVHFRAAADAVAAAPPRPLGVQFGPTPTPPGSRLKQGRK